MSRILKSRLTFSFEKIFLAGAVCFPLLLGITCPSDAMSEDEYAAMAAENMILLHQAGGDSRAIQKASEDFLNKFPPEKVEEYIMMARQMMQDQALAMRVSEKITSILSSRGYELEGILQAAPDLGSAAP